MAKPIIELPISKKPTDMELKKLKEYFKEMPVEEILSGLKMKNMVGGAKLSMEQISLRLSTVSELGDIVVTLSPCMSIIKGLAPSLREIMPDANASMQELSQTLGDVMSGSTLTMGDSLSIGAETNADSLAILEEAHNVIAGQTESTIPEVPDSLKQQIVERKSDILI